MASLISDLEKSSLQSVFNDIHDTFKRKIKFYRKGKIVAFSKDPNFNPLFKKTSVDTEVQEQEIEARVFYIKSKAKKEQLRPSSENDVSFEQETADIRIKIQESDFGFFKGVERIYVDDSIYIISSPAIPHGLFSTGFRTIYLTKTS